MTPVLLTHCSLWPVHTSFLRKILLFTLASSMDRLLAERMGSDRSERNPCLGERKNAWIRKGTVILRLKSYLELVNMDVTWRAWFCAISHYSGRLIQSHIEEETCWVSLNLEAYHKERKEVEGGSNRLHSNLCIEADRERGQSRKTGRDGEKVPRPGRRDPVQPWFRKESQMILDGTGLRRA